MSRITGFINDLKDNEIFVFGSNRLGIHGKGAALTAKRKFGAKCGVGSGLTGRCYAFVTVETIRPYKISSLSTIRKEAIIFYTFAKEHKELHFLLTEVGCGEAGYTPKEIAPLFKECIELDNVSMPQSFWNVLKNM